MRLPGFDLGGLDVGSGWVRLRMNEHRSLNDFDAEGGYLLLERGRSSPRFRFILITVPRAGNAPVYDATFAQRSILILANVRNSGDLAVVAKYGYALPIETNDGRALFGNAIYFADLDKTFLGDLAFRFIDPLSPKCGGEVERDHGGGAHNQS